MMSITFGLSGAKPPAKSPILRIANKQLHEFAEQEGKKAFGKKVESDLQERIESAITEIEKLAEGEDRIFWMQMICAYKRRDLNELEQLQNDKKSEIIQEQMLIIDFICATHITIDAQPNEVILSNMASIRESSFFKQITKQ
jgi:hypothetical protein